MMTAGDLLEYLLLDADVPIASTTMRSDSNTLEVMLTVAGSSEEGDLLYGPSRSFRLTIEPINE